MNRFTSIQNHQHGCAPRTAILLVNLGTPQSPTPRALRTYLAEFLSDPRVVELPPWLWQPLLHGVILRTRPRASARKYASIWTPQGSPLQVGTQQQAQGLLTQLHQQGHTDLIVRWAMRYGSPNIPETLSALQNAGATRILIVPLYPQYAGATTGSAFDAVSHWVTRTRWVPELRWIQGYASDHGYIQALAQRVLQHWEIHGRADKLVLSFHGLPRQTLTRGDPYYCECQMTARLLTQALDLSPQEVVIAFQSRLGRAQWLQPYTAPTLVSLAQNGLRRVDVMCPGFACDNLETLEEINIEARQAFIQAGGDAFHYIACLNDQPRWLEALASLVMRHLGHWLDEPPPHPEALDAQRQHATALGAPT